MAEVDMESRYAEPSDNTNQSNREMLSTAEANMDTKDTELGVNKNQSSNRETEVDLRPNQNSTNDGDESHHKCYSCYVCCNACCKRCMMEHNPLPDSPTRSDILLTLGASGCLVATPSGLVATLLITQTVCYLQLLPVAARQ